MNPNTPDGLLVVDKPTGMTSRDAVNIAQRWFPRKTRIGHTGTLDPLATGVLVLCIGSATRLVEYVQEMRKTYVSTFRLGATSDSDDADGSVTPTANAVLPSEATLRAALDEFVGPLDQVPPAFSAAHVDGKRAYDLARKGESVELRPRRVEVYSLEVLSLELPDVVVRIECSKGTYIRSIARDLGQRLGCGGYVQTLRRTAVGVFTEEQALALDPPPEDPVARLLPSALALTDLPRVTVSARDADRLRNGQRLTTPPGLDPTSEVAVFTEHGVVVCVAKIDSRRGQLQPAKVLPRCARRE